MNTIKPTQMLLSGAVAIPGLCQEGSCDGSRSRSEQDESRQPVDPAAAAVTRNQLN